MGRITISGHYECEVGGVYHICYYSPPEIQDIVTKQGKENEIVDNGRIFPYIAHYLTTGDLIYPTHEGEEHISLLLEELGRLGLVQQLFPKQTNSKTPLGVFRSPCKGCSKNDTNAKLRIRTKDERWKGVSKAFSKLLRIPKSDLSKAHQVYRPPQQSKGITLVLVRSSMQGNNHIKIHGPSSVLESLVPNALTIDTQQTHHHLNCHLIPLASSAHSIVMSLEDQGFVNTVRSSWVEGKTGALITQWLLYRRSSNKRVYSSSGTSSRKSASLGKSLSVSRKLHRSNSTKKKMSKSGSTGRIRKSALSFGNETTKDKVDQGSIGSGSLSSDKNSNNSIINGSNSDLRSKDGIKISFADDTMGSSASNSPSNSSRNSPNSSPSSSHMSANLSLSFKSIPQTLKETEESRLKALSYSTLPSKKMDENNSTDNLKYLTLGNKSLSINSIAQIPPKKLKSSPSLWNLCSKSSVKRVFSVLF